MRTRPAIESLEARDLPAASFESLPVLPFNDLAPLDHARAIFAHGQRLGRDADVVLKIGDSNSSPFPISNFLAPLGSVTYDPLANGLYQQFASLLDTWWAFRSGFDSLAHEGPTAEPGWRTDNVLAALAGEIRATNPAIALVMIGTNDAMVFGDAKAFHDHLSLIVRQLLAAGVVPVLSTLPDSHFRSGAFEPTIRVFNQVIANVAAHFAVPLWNLQRSLGRLPSQGLSSDGVHLDVSPNGGGSFWPGDLLFAQNLRNLQALRILDWFRETIAQGTTTPPTKKQWEPLPVSRSVYAVGADVRFAPVVSVYDAGTGQLTDRFQAFDLHYTGGVSIATGDVNGDGFTDVVCATRGPRGRVAVISGGDGAVLSLFRPYGGHPAAGIRIALGDLDGDGALEIVVARDSSPVRVFDGRTGTLNARFQPEPHRQHAVRVAVATIQGVGPVVVVASGRRHPVVRLLNPDGVVVSSFEPFAHGHGAVEVATADLDGDGSDEIVAVRSGGSPKASVFSGTTHALLGQLPLAPNVDPAFGVRLGTLRSTNGPDMLLVGSAPGSPVVVQGFDDLSGHARLLRPDHPARAYGIFVG